MRRILGVLVMVIAVLGVAGCSQADLKAEDAYKIGCPAVDAAVAGGGVAGKATSAGLKALRDSGQLDAEPQKWLNAAIELLDSSDHRPSSDSAKQLIIDGCAKNGYPLRNLT